MAGTNASLADMIDEKGIVNGALAAYPPMEFEATDRVDDAVTRLVNYANEKLLETCRKEFQARLLIKAGGIIEVVPTWREKEDACILEEGRNTILPIYQVEPDGSVLKASGYCGFETFKYLELITESLDSIGRSPVYLGQVLGILEKQLAIEPEDPAPKEFQGYKARIQIAWYAPPKEAETDQESDATSEEPFDILLERFSQKLNRIANQRARQLQEQR